MTMHLVQDNFKRLCGAPGSQAAAGWWYVAWPKRRTEYTWCPKCLERLPLAQLADMDLEGSPDPEGTGDCGCAASPCPLGSRVNSAPTATR